MKWIPYEINEPVKIKCLYSMFMPHYDRGFDFRGEMHDFWECMYIIDGSVCVSADENVHNLKSGDIIFHKPMELHKFYIDSENGADFLIFSFSMEGPLCKKTENCVCHLTNSQRAILEALIKCYRKECEKFKSEHLDDIWKDDTFKQKTATYIIQLILSLAEKERVSRPVDAYDTQLFKNAVDYMNECIYSNITVNEIAERLNISASTLKRIFDKYAGISVYKYFLTLKIKTATALLQSGSSVSQVSDRLGFCNQGYFSATYKRETGRNPSQI